MTSIDAGPLQLELPPCSVLWITQTTPEPCRFDQKHADIFNQQRCVGRRANEDNAEMHLDFYK